MIYGVSGAAALVYEVTWTRMLTLQIGHGVAAASTVVSAFMGGLAIGSAAGGRLARRLSPQGALRAYVGLEIAVAVLALLLPFGLALLQPLLVTMYADGNSGWMFPLFRLCTSLLLLSLPAAAMGATFPVASRWFVPDAAGAAGAAGRLYAVNTIGAGAGAVLAGFVLLPAMGLRRAIWAGIALNLMAAVFAALMSKRAADLTPAPAGTTSGRAKRAGTATTPGGSGLFWIAGVALGLSGFASLALQVVWTRVLALIVGPTTYAFSVIVAVFICGLAAGSTLAARFAPQSRQPVVGLIGCLLLSAVSAIAAAASVDRALLAMAEIVARDLEFGDVLIRQVLLVAALLAPMAVAFGAAFPFAVSVGTKVDRTVVSDLGLIYALNTAGAIGGALLAGFVLIPRLGLHDTIRGVTVVVAVGAFFLLAGARAFGRVRLVGFAASMLVVLSALALPSWDEALLSSGVYKYSYASRLGGPDLKTSLTAGRLLYYREGAAATVAVREAVGSRSLSIDGKVDASNAGDMLTQRLLAHLPLLLHPEPRQVAIIGLGSGVTLGSALTHPIARADTLEISPEVVEASGAFEHENHRALADPRTRLVIADGRSHLMLSRLQYDVIISEPSNPWMAGIASLFTHEFFQSVRDRLAPGGIFCQWAHTYDMRDDDLRSIVATFLSVFPDGTLWLVGGEDVLLVGSTDALHARLADIASNWGRPGVDHDLLDIGVREPFALLSLFVAEGRDLARYAVGAPLQTDDLGRLEFSGPRSIFGRQINRNADILREVGRTSTVPAVVQAAITEAGSGAWRDRGWMLLRAEAYDDAWRDFTRAVEMDPNDANPYSGLIRAAVATSRSRVDETLSQLKRLAANTPSLEAQLAVSRLLATQGANDESVTIGFDLARRSPGNLRVLEQLASVLADTGDTQRLQPIVAQLRQVAPGSQVTGYYTAALLFMQGRPDLSVPELESVVRENPQHALAQNLLGAALASLGDRERARHAFEASLRADPLGAGTYTNLATLEMEAGNALVAAQRFAEALTLDPTSDAAQRGLAEATARR